MKRYLLTITLAVMLCGTASAQSEFLNGYIIKKDGSYTYGLLKYIAKGYSVDECVFRWFDISSEYVFLPEDIASFGFTHGMRYKAVTDRGRKIFMACLSDGELDLLYDGSRLYLDGMGLEMVRLGSDAGSVNAEGKMVSFNGFSDLIEKLPDPENRFTVPSDLSLKPEKMAEVISAYNESRGVKAPMFPVKNPSGVYEEMQNLGAFRNSYGVLAGMNASRYDADKRSLSSYTFVPEMTFFEITPVAGIFYKRRLSRSNELMSLQAEVSVFRNSVYLYQESTAYRSISRSDINFGFTGIKTPLYLQFAVSIKRFLPFVNVGAYGVNNLGGKYTRVGETESPTHVVRPFEDNSIAINKSTYGVMAGAGVRMKLNPRQSLFIEVRAEKGTGVFVTEKRIDQQTLSLNLFAGFNFR